MMESKQTGTFALAGDSEEIINLTRRSRDCREECRMLLRRTQIDTQESGLAGWRNCVDVHLSVWVLGLALSY